MPEAINPATGELIQRYEPHGSDEIERRLQTASAAFQAWRATPLGQRADLMRSVAEQLRSGRNDLARLMTDEMGKPITQARGEVEKCAWVCEYYAEHAGAFLQDEVIGSPARTSYVKYQPLGPVLAVMPWNFPLWQVFRFAAPALMAGNVGLLKHASNVPGTALAIERLFEAAGFPTGVFQTLLIGSGPVAEVIADRRVVGVALTGSEAAGRKVAEIAGRALKKSVLELGGSDAFVVLEDADVERAAQVACLARTQNSGQSCIAAKRFIVVDSIYDAFIERFQAFVSELRVGDPHEESTDVGPLARRDLRDELHNQVLESIEKGARCLLGGEPLPGPGAYYPATILADVAPGMPAYDEELFGPVAAVIRVRDEEEAIRVANDTRFGLGASIWTRDLGRGEAVAARIEAGATFINGLVRSDPRVPFGGIKDSGYGRELSYHGIREFVNVKTIWVD